MKRVGISILTNGERLDYLRRCVESLLARTSYRPLVVAIYDNASTDGTAIYIDRLKESRELGVEWRSGRAVVDQGVSVGINRAMAMVADCEWAIHVESDFELIDPDASGHGRDWLEKAVEWAEGAGCDYLYLRRILDEREVMAHWWWRWPGRIAPSAEPFQMLPGFWWSNNPALRRNPALAAAGVLPLPERPRESKDRPYWSKSEMEAVRPPNAAIMPHGVFAHEWSEPRLLGCDRFERHGMSTCKYGFFQDPGSMWCRVCDPMAPWNCLAEHYDAYQALLKGDVDASVATVWVRAGVLHDILARSLSGCRVERLLTRGRPETCLATEYNRMLGDATSDVVVFCEPDAEFSHDGLQNVVEAVQRPDVGAAGLVGARRPDGEIWSRDASVEQDVETLDACVMGVDRTKGFKFDDGTFTGLHLHVEDYCCQVRAAGLRCLVVPSRRFEHHSTTWSERGPDWGDYGKWKRTLLDKWRGRLGEVRTT